MTLWQCNRRKEHDRTVVTIDGYEDVPEVSQRGASGALPDSPADPSAWHPAVLAASLDPAGSFTLVVFLSRSPTLSFLQSESNLVKAAANQPIAVGICASESMMYYAGGVIDKVRAE